MWFQGTLVVKTITGRNGPFNVAKLHLDVGEFAAKHPLIQQLDEGRYPITTDIDNFFIATRPANGATISEMAAWVRDIQFQSDEAQQGQEISDPLMAAGLVEEPEDDPSTPSTAGPAPEGDGGLGGSPDDVQRLEHAPETPDPDSEVTKLFGDLATAVLARQPVKLDPAVGSLMRKQVDYLKANGFKFKSIEKIWVSVSE